MNLRGKTMTRKILNRYNFFLKKITLQQISDYQLFRNEK